MDEWGPFVYCIGKKSVSNNIISVYIFNIVSMLNQYCCINNKEIIACNIELVPNLNLSFNGVTHAKE